MRENLHLPVPSPRGWNSSGCPRLKPGTRRLIWVSHGGAGAEVLGSRSAAFPGVLTGSWGKHLTHRLSHPLGNMHPTLKNLIRGPGPRPPIRHLANANRWIIYWTLNGWSCLAGVTDVSLVAKVPWTSCSRPNSALSAAGQVTWRGTASSGLEFFSFKQDGATLLYLMEDCLIRWVIW